MGLSEALAKLLAAGGGSIVLRSHKRVDLKNHSKIETKWYQCEYARGDRDHLLTSLSVPELIARIVEAARGQSPSSHGGRN